MSKPRNAIKKSFDFSKGEMNGLVAMVCIILLLILAPWLYDRYQDSQISNDRTALKAIQQLVFAEKKRPHYTTDKVVGYDEDEKFPTSLFQFDPNTLSLAGWQKLGLSEKQAQSIINYRNKGGRFYKPHDLSKMYTITPQKFAALEPYIQIGPMADQKAIDKARPNLKKELVIVELNSADTIQMDAIKGVGAAFARRITKYRDRIGGFHSKSQLLEVYGLDSLKFEEIKGQVNIDASLIKKIAINKVQFNDLKGNPYLNFKQINALINYRKQHGDYKSIDDLKKVILLNPTVLEKIAPYLIY